MTSYLVTAAARGIGLELTNQLLNLPSDQVGQIIAPVRRESSELHKLVEKFPGRIKVIEIEAITVDGISKALGNIEDALSGQGLDVLINVVGSKEPVVLDGLKALKSADLLTSISTNVLTTHVMISQMLPLLEKGRHKRVINISTTVGSMALARDAHSIPTPAYKISKAALNMLTVQYALDLEKEGFTCVALSPGWLKTDLGGKDAAHLDVSTGVAALRDVIVSITQKDNGKFLNIKVQGWEGTYDGEEVPW